MHSGRNAAKRYPGVFGRPGSRGFFRLCLSHGIVIGYGGVHCLFVESNPAMQIIAVGDMEQKIYDKTTLNVESFMKEFFVTVTFLFLILDFASSFRSLL